MAISHQTDFKIIPKLLNTRIKSSLCHSCKLVSKRRPCIALGAAMKKLLSTTAIAASLLALGSAAHAAFIPTDASFFTAPSDGTLTFTFEGSDAGDTNEMRLTLGNVLIFVNHSTPLGTVFNAPVFTGVTYQLNLVDLTTPNTWSSDPALNTVDNSVHLAGNNVFSDFNLPLNPMNPPFPVSTNCAFAGGCYLGWEDRAFPSADGDFNDLVFALQFTSNAAIPEPSTLGLIGLGLLGLGAMRRRRQQSCGYLS